MDSEDCDSIAIQPHYGSFGFAYDGNFFVLGGSNYRNFQKNLTISKYNLVRKVWESFPLKGKCLPPSAWSGFKGAVIGKKLYTFGGFVMNSNGGYCRTNRLDCLDMDSLEMNGIMAVGSTQPIPKDKHECFAYRGKLYVFGGYGVPSKATLSNPSTFEYHRLEGGYDDSNLKQHYWTNEFHECDFERSEWFAVKTVGFSPPLQSV